MLDGILSFAIISVCLFRLNRVSDYGESREEFNERHPCTCVEHVPDYMAPETISRYEVSLASNVYSFSIMSVELWNEAPAFSYESVKDLFLDVLQGKGPIIRDSCPKPLVELLTQCWASDQDKRPSFKTVVKRLAPVVEGVRVSLPQDIEHVKPIETT